MYKFKCIDTEYGYAICLYRLYFNRFWVRFKKQNFDFDEVERMNKFVNRTMEILI